MPHAYTILEIAKIINDVYGNAALIDYDYSAPEAVKSTYMDISLLEGELGYTPMDMREALMDLKSCSK